MKYQELFLCDKSEIKLTGIYTIEHTARPGIFYVGSAQSIDQKYRKVGFYGRWMKHICELQNNKHHSRYLQRVVNKYGLEGLRFEIIEFCEPNRCLNLEQYWINVLYQCNYKYGYNTQSIPNSNIGIKPSVESIKKRQNTCALIRKSYENQIIELYNKHTIKEISNILNICVNTIAQTLKKNAVKTQSLQHKNKQILQIDLNDNVIKVWNNVPEIKMNLKIKDTSAIYEKLNGVPGISYGYKWKYQDRS